MIHYLNLKNFKHFNSRTEFVRSFLSGKKGKLLDVGNLGDGVISVDVKKMVESSRGEYWGLDINKNLSDKLKINNQIIGDFHDIPCKNDRFDFLYAGQIIEHTWRPSVVLSEFNRILKTNSCLIIDTPNVYDSVALFRLLIRGKETLGDSKKFVFEEVRDGMRSMRDKGLLLSQPQHKIFYSPAMLEQLLIMNGFKIKTFAFISKPRNILHRLLLMMFPQISQQIGIIAEKTGASDIFKTYNI